MGSPNNDWRASKEPARVDRLEKKSYSSKLISPGKPCRDGRKRYLKSKNYTGAEFFLETINKEIQKLFCFYNSDLKVFCLFVSIKPLEVCLGM